ncbi:MAG: hypothetical protein HW405_398 [Candidatus Berkelbacteria bacterium]|nr:hypothetical protein [Candidatus Berkelbacteria bacterium]
MSYQVHQYKHKKSAEVQIVEGFFKAIWWIMSLPFRLIFGKKSARGRSASGGKVELNKTYINTKWQEIAQLIQLGHPSNYTRAVLEADKLLDHILKGYRAPGMTMGDRLKASENRFSKEGYNAAWQAHKVRNELVHNSQYELMDYSAKDAINNFKKAIDELIR